MSKIVELIIDDKSSSVPFGITALKTNDSPNPSLKSILQNKIFSVLQKISESDHGILWVIYPYLTLPFASNNWKICYRLSLCNCIKVIIPEKTTTFSLDRDYFTNLGFSLYEHKIIFIADNAIQNTLSSSIFRNLESKYSYLHLKNKLDDQLANIIMDELAHIKSQRDHGDQEYDDLLKNYIVKYYGL